MKDDCALVSRKELRTNQGTKARKPKCEKMLGVIRVGAEGGGCGKGGCQVLGFYSSFYWLLEKL